MRHNGSEHIQIMYYTSCQGSSDEVKQSNKCDDLKIGEEVEFKVEIKVLSCPNNRTDWNQTLKIFPVGSQEAILVHLVMICDCPCEHQDDHVSNMHILLKSATKHRLTTFVFEFNYFAL
jgi:protocadherin alpha